ncbi:MAG: 50S ribosomal protein L7/L12 [Spirochaetae bacterium HGW-Spirochaetae-8]|nr:MAG: 50S ribosomal protein L7/L12 [Spirochaetae bacterium HGW-Spirochaetae-8]
MATQEEILESIANMTVMQVADLIKAMETKFGVTAAAPVAAAGAAAAAVVEEVEEQTEFDIVLKGVAEGKTIPVIKEVRAITGLGLKEAKDLVTAGGTIKEAVTKDEAKALKEKLEAAGATIEVK